MSDFWSDLSSTSILHVCEQRRLCGCADLPEPSLVAYVISTIISRAGSNIKGWTGLKTETVQTSDIVFKVLMESVCLLNKFPF